ncbi:MAG: flavodoxin-dependent (E)-4-hydroxy-3-methylbut-2-enyl-diphosphate synthase, partial [Thermodesulfovibrionales bacterium]|nr:flavodoxin-dependent (E)-4-hydroxy-3-methylbut-2-enyl-diphosphate synthase [Thermodesulfovibrionales bacterium]
MYRITMARINSLSRQMNTLRQLRHTGKKSREKKRCRSRWTTKRRTRGTEIRMGIRKKTRTIHVGKVPVGGGNPVSVQSMTKTDTRDVKATVKQIKALEKSGCEIIRLAVPDMDAAKALGRIKKSASIPMIADIHFDWRLALEAIKQGVDGLRINPGNIGAKWKVKEVVASAKDNRIPIRIGVNAGSLEKELLQKYGHPKPEALVKSAEGHIRILEDMNFKEIKVS